MRQRPPTTSTYVIDPALRARQRPIVADWPDLPVVERRAEIAHLIGAHQVVVVTGETGSGKTTQLPKICLELGRGTHGLIGHTQPRRLAARTVSQRIAEELNQPLGQAVGYKIRFNDQTRRDTYIKLMTDGILLAETQTDRDLGQYDTLIIDEAHERSLNIDFLLGYLKRLLPRRPDLKLIITSATIDPARFSRHFDDCPILEVSGRTYPVETRYFPLSIDERTTEDLLDGEDASSPSPPGGEGGVRGNLSAAGGQTSGSKRPPHPNPLPQGRGDQKDADLTELDGITQVAEMLVREGRGDMLVFLPTERDIREAAEALAENRFLNADILPLYSRLSSAEQLKVFHPDGKRRRIILSTNVAETSVTVPGIHCVIDTGLARLSRYSTRTKVQRLPIEPISQASADQRKGRCGRVGPGVCVRLFSEKDYLERPKFTDPEILRTNLASVILQMMWLRLGKIEAFPFLDPPDGRQIRDGLATLHEIGAIDEEENLTPIGKRLAKLPVDPRVGRMIVGGQDEECVEEIVVIAAALSTQDVRERPSDQQDAADQAHAKFRDDQSDFISILKLWRTLRAKQTELSNSQFRKWCRANFVNYLRYREWTDVHQQLCEMLGVAPWQDRTQAIRPVARGTLGRHRAPFTPGQRPGTERGSARPPEAGAMPRREEDEVDLTDPFPPQRRDAIHRALLPGLLSNVAMKAEAGGFTGARSTRFNIWPGSALFKSRPLWIMAAELVETTKLYARTVAPVRVEWVERAARHLVKRHHWEPHWVSQTAHVHALEKVTLYGLLLIPRRSVHFGPIDPVQSRQIFIHHALVLGDFRTDHPALVQNKQRIKEIEGWQEKLRRRDLLGSPEARYAFFEERIPPHVYSGPTFDQWAKRGQGSNSHELELSDKELISDSYCGHPGHSGCGQDAHSTELRRTMTRDYPDALALDGVKLPLEYRFEPGEDDDGITAVVPVTALSQIPDARAEWLVPGMVKQKVDELIRSLPKRLRTLFVPVNQTTDAVMAKLPPFGIGSLLDQVAGILWKISGQVIQRSDFQPDQLAPNLSMNFRVIGGQGEVLAEGRDLPELRAKLGQKVQQSFTTLSDPRYTRDDLQRWDFADLPERVPIDYHGAKLFGYPTLVEQGNKVSLRLLDSPEQSNAMMPQGLRRLFMIETAKELKHTLRDLPNLESLRLNYRTFGTGEELMEDLTLVLADRAFFDHETGIVRTKEAFADRGGRAWKRLFETSRNLGKLITEVLDRYRSLHSLLNRTYPPLLIDNVDDMRKQLSKLLPKRWVSTLPGDKLEQLPRYLRGIESRLTRLLNAGLSKDLSGLMQIRPLQQQYDDTARRHAQRGVIDPALTEYRWLVEEYRLQLFAQEIKTIVPVSPKRLEQVWQTVKRV